MQWLKYTIRDKNIVTTMMNVMYAVFLGLLASTIIHINNSPGNHTVTLIVDRGNLLWLLLFLSYFVLDWFSANVTMLYDNGVNHFILMASLILVAWFGTMMVASVSPSFGLMCSFALYAVFVPLGDFFVTGNAFLLPQLKWRLPFLIITILRLSIASYLCINIISLKLWCDGAEQASATSNLIVWVGVYVALKLLRYLWLIFPKRKYGRGVKCISRLF